MRFLILLTVLVWLPSTYAQTPPAGTMTISTEEYFRLYNQGKGCLTNMLEQTSQSLSSTFEAQMNETNVLLGIAQKYFELDQKCGNDLADVILELNQEKLRHDQMLRQLPVKIKAKQIEYQQALLAIKKDCEKTSGKAFLAWKQGVSSGVITNERGGFNALVGRNEKTNKFQKLFYEDCLVSQNNLASLDLLKQQLENNLDALQTEIESSAAKLATMTENSSLKQERTLKNCKNSKEQLKYQEAIARNQASATNALAMKQNLMGLLAATQTCVKGPGTAETTGAGAAATN